MIYLTKKHLNDSCYKGNQREVLLFLKQLNFEYCYDVPYKNAESLVAHCLYLLFLCISFLSAFLIFLRNMCSAGWKWNILYWVLQSKWAYFKGSKQFSLQASSQAKTKKKFSAVYKKPSCKKYIQFQNVVYCHGNLCKGLSRYSFCTHYVPIN